MKKGNSFVLFSAAQAPSPSVEPDCEVQDPEKDRWRSGCNWCRCSSTGVGFCTLTGCPQAVLEQLADQPVCEGNPRWMKDQCNWCSCVNGNAACTEMGCLGSAVVVPAPISRSDAPAAESSEPVCEVGPERGRWREDCNWCRCVKGEGACTKRRCPPALRDSLSETPECEGTIRWKRDCNWCSCLNGNAACTEMGCLGSAVVVPALIARSAAPAAEPSEPVCEVGSEGGRWRQDCNWCRCIGSEGACTKRGCPPALRETLSETPECEGTIRWKRDCNWCSCVNGKAVCTLAACFDRADFPALNQGAAPSSPEDECEAESQESRWRKDCNWCRCMGGNGVCTKRGCPPGEFSPT